MSARPAPGGPARPSPQWWLPLAPLAGVLALTAGLLVTGATAQSPLVPTGALVRWGLPLAKVVVDLATAATLGGLVMATFVLPAPRSGRPGREQPVVPAPVMVLVAAAATVWAAGELALLVLGYADVSGRPLQSPGFGSELLAYAHGLDQGRQPVVAGVLAAVIGLVAAAASTLRTAALLMLTALVAVVPAALAGHSALVTGHETAVTALGLHLVGAAVWVGGLLTLVLTAGRLGDQLPVVTARYSRLALVALLAVGFSGVVNAWLRLPAAGDLVASGYGRLVVTKALALVVLGGFGWWHRTRTLPALAQGRRYAFLRLAVVEVVVMAATVGVAAALARSAPPVGPVALPTLVESITGYSLPPAPSASVWLTVWQPDLMWVLLCGAGGLGYLVGVRRLRRRGDGWPWPRTAAWFAGLAVVVYVTCGAPAAYGRLMFSAHMLGHMTLSMAAPILLVTAAPVTLALRVLPARTDGSRGAREWLTALIGSRFLRVLSLPPVAAFLFAGSLVVFYFSPLLPLALSTHVGHELMQVHFLLAGYLFAWVLVGVDPGPHRPTYPLRLVLLLATLGFHAFFAVALMTSTQPLAAGWFSALSGHPGVGPFGDPLLADQHLGGGLTWGMGELPTLALALVLAVQWSRSDEREARRTDRQADRDGDAELNAYNAMLGRLSGPAQRPGPAGPPDARAGRARSGG